MSDLYLPSWKRACLLLITNSTYLNARSLIPMYFFFWAQYFWAPLHRRVDSISNPSVCRLSLTVPRYVFEDTFTNVLYTLPPSSWQCYLYQSLSKGILVRGWMIGLRSHCSKRKRICYRLSYVYFVAVHYWFGWLLSARWSSTTSHWWVTDLIDQSLIEYLTFYPAC